RDRAREPPKQWAGTRPLRRQPLPHHAPRRAPFAIIVPHRGVAGFGPCLIRICTNRSIDEHVVQIDLRNSINASHGPRGSETYFLPSAVSSPDAPSRLISGWSGKRPVNHA